LNIAVSFVEQPDLAASDALYVQPDTPSFNPIPVDGENAVSVTVPLRADTTGRRQDK
jgi:hypothetical protein